MSDDRAEEVAVTGSWKIRAAVPQRYWHRTGLDKYSFQVIDPWHKVISFRKTPTGQARPIAPSVVVTHRSDGSIRHLLVDLDDYPVLSEALLLLGQLNLGIGNRIQRYLTLYKAYEAITDRPNPKFASLRHALAHPATMLSSQLTVAQLTQLFGTRFFDIDDPAHQRVFYVQMARLIMATDARLGRLLDYAYRATVLSSRNEALLDWEVYGVAGFREPMELSED